MKNLFYTLIAVLALASCAKEEEVIAPPAPNKYTLTITADTGGSVSSPGGTYNEGSKITITATPDGQYLFEKWSDGSTINPREITVTSNLTLSATFVNKNPLYLDTNGVTIKAYDYAEVGDIWELDGEEYLIVDETLLRSMVANNEDVTKVVTSSVTNMSNMFDVARVFNQDIGGWDTSSVTDMEFMFNKAYALNRDLSGWCVTNIPSVPTDFATRATAWSLPKPVWGTCP